MNSLSTIFSRFNYTQGEHRWFKGIQITLSRNSSTPGPQLKEQTCSERSLMIRVNQG